MENNTVKRHNISLDGRRRGIVSGVSRVLGATDRELSLETALGNLSIRGTELHIVSFAEQSGELSFDGNIDKLEYAKAHKPMLKRLFK